METKKMSAQDVCDLLREKSLLSDRGLRLALNGDAVMLDIGSITAIVNAALAQRVVSSSPSAPCEAVLIGTIKEGQFSNRFEFSSDEIASDSSLIGASAYTTPPAAPVALGDEQIRADLKKGLFVGYGETHRAVVEETVQVLESAASYNLSMLRTILAHDQQERANRLRSILNQTTKEPK